VLWRRQGRPERLWQPGRTHSCAGLAKADNLADEWKYVAKGTCKDMKGMSAEEAKSKAKKG
jgi:uncharacterized membrane protein